MERIESILVATDLSAASDSALIHAARLAKDADAPLKVVHIASSETTEVLGSVMPETKGASEAYFKKHATKELGARLGELNLAVEPSLEIRFGKPHKQIMSALEESGANLLVLGATGQGGRRLGTVAGRCIRMSPVSVLQIPAGHADRFTSIVACVDFSEESREVLRQASVMAEYEQAKLHALYVYHIPDVSPFYSSNLPDLGAIKEFPNVMASRFKEQLEPAARGAEVSLSLVEHIDYTKGILEHVRRKNIDLIAVGTTQRTKLGYAIMGTTAEKVIRDSEGAVLAVR